MFEKQPKKTKGEKKARETPFSPYVAARFPHMSGIDPFSGDCPSIGLRGDVIAASFGKVSMQREELRSRGPMFLLRYLAALLR